MDLIWPFRVKTGDGTDGGIGNSSTQWRRIDEGQDLQTDVGADVLAILAGTVHFAHDPGTDGGHFGATYPWVALDEPWNGEVAYYLGHTYPAVPEGTHVNQGDVVSHTGNPGNGGAPAGWLEVGWWRNGPVGKGGGWTQAGQDMHNHLVNAPVHEGDDMFTQQDRDTLDNVQKVLAEIQSALGNQIKPELDQVHDAAAREDAGVADVVAGVEAIEQHDGLTT